MTNRSRSEGWKFAKSDGHNNESLFGDLLRSEFSIADFLWNKHIGQSLKANYEVLVDGSKKVESVLDKKTTSKVDVAIVSESKATNISLKKNDSGQVWLVSIESFLRLMELEGQSSWDSAARRGLRLFIGGAVSGDGDKESLIKGLEYSKRQGFSSFSHEERNRRLSAGSIKAVDRDAYESLLEALRASIGKITNLAFAKGAAKNQSDFAHLVIYNNSADGIKVLSTQDLVSGASALVNVIKPGPQNSGTTIWLPWGFLQMHHPQKINLLQFHHREKDIDANYKSMIEII